MVTKRRQVGGKRMKKFRTSLADFSGFVIHL